MNDWLPGFALASKEAQYEMRFDAAVIEMLYPGEFQGLAALRDSIISWAQHIKTEEESWEPEPKVEGDTSKFDQLWDHRESQRKLIDEHRQMAEEIAIDLKRAIQRRLQSVRKRRSVRLKLSDCGWRRHRLRDGTWRYPQWEIHPTAEKYDEYLWLKFVLTCGEFRDHRDRSGGIDDVP